MSKIVLLGLICFTTVFVVTEAERPTTCPDGYTQHDASCYAMFGQNVSWIDAQSYCDKFGADLLRIDSVQEAAKVKRLIQGHPGAYWLDANDVLTEGVWRYSGRSGDRLPFSQWRTGKPDSATVTEDCAVIFPSDGGWDDMICSNQFNFICEIELSNGS